MILKDEQMYLKHPVKERLEAEERQFKDIQKQMNAQTLFAKTEKTGRNDPCPCGNGKKYKKGSLK